MKGSFDLDPIGKWRRIEKHPHRLTFEHPDTGDRLVVLRIRGPEDRDGHEDYVLRHIAPDKASWKELTTVDSISSVENDLQEAMQRFLCDF
jgi:hypothetical protein